MPHGYFLWFKTHLTVPCSLHKRVDDTARSCVAVQTLRVHGRDSAQTWCSARRHGARKWSRRLAPFALPTCRRLDSAVSHQSLSHWSLLPRSSSWPGKSEHLSELVDAVALPPWSWVCDDGKQGKSSLHNCAAADDKFVPVQTTLGGTTRQRFNEPSNAI